MYIGREDQVQTVGYYIRRTNQQGSLASKSRYVNLGSWSYNLRGQLEQEHNVGGKKQIVLCRPKSRLGFFIISYRKPNRKPAADVFCIHVFEKYFSSVETYSNLG